MSKNEKELLEIVRKDVNPELALITATALILEFLKQHESSEEQVVVCPQESV